MIVGRREERNALLRLVESDEPQFCVVYGRRRVGKTYLIRETFNYNFTFQHTGVANGNLKRQLSEFKESLRLAGLAKCPTPKNWFEAFGMLYELIDKSTDKKKVIFIDELPWLDTPKSGLLSALEHFWNARVTARPQKDVVLIICGSSTSWITQNILGNHGGLHNRRTESIHLQPFTLAECETYAKIQGLMMERKEIMETYMVLGGVPYYWNFLSAGLGLVQNIDKLFFDSNAKLSGEFDALYRSLFKKPEPYLTVITALGKMRKGLTRDEIIKKTGISSGGVLVQVLEDLEQCGFIRRYYAFDKKERGSIYQLIDNFTLFHLMFIEGNHSQDNNFWTNRLVSDEHSTWQGLSFERVCLQHIEQIKQALGISGVISNVCAWSVSKTADHPGTQIDLLIERRDNIINLCEMKFSAGKYVVSKDDFESMNTKRNIFKQVTKTSAAIHLTLITSNELARSGYFSSIQREVTLDDLFK